ncbi:hypothetical protein BPOR_0808g00010 [Botrytis porri]|uniref:Uncharacterized protein n=1 Tax=Botrytis porri TaxID=87229 RepID=A0A4Z1KMT9_9HELO|nr:hypothetical protein BPOR_0808g00010 [Botrytis porri]
MSSFNAETVAMLAHHLPDLGEVSHKARFQAICSIGAAETVSQGEIAESALIEASSGIYVTC